MQNFTIRPQESGQTLAAVLKHRLSISWSKAKELITAKRVRLAGQPVDIARRVKAGQQVEFVQSKPHEMRPASIRSAPPFGITLHHIDDHVLVVDKPAGLTTMRHHSEAAEFGKGKKYLPKTLADFLPSVAGDGKPIIPVHRIDKDTSGLVVFARNDGAAKFLGDLFRRHDIERVYHAIVRGEAKDQRIESNFVADRGDGRRGSGTGPGQRAITLVRLIQQLGPMSLVECRLETGRTHQIRIHLGEAGTPLAGERIYDRPIHGAPAADLSGAKRVMLHAAILGFAHPAGGKLRFESPLPADFVELVAKFTSK